MVEVAGPLYAMSVGGAGGDRGWQTAGNIPCEVVGFSGNNALVLPFGAAGRRAAGLPCDRVVDGGGGAAVYRPGSGGCINGYGRADRREGAAAGWAGAGAVPQ